MRSQLVVPLSLLISVALCASFLASPVQNLTVTTTSFHNLTEPPPVHCYDSEPPHDFPVNPEVCLPVTRQILTMRGAERPSPHNTGNMPLIIEKRGTPCVVTLNAYNPRGGEDVFSIRVVGLKAVEILETCGEGVAKVGYGGRGTVGLRELFWVGVEWGWETGVTNETATE